MNKKELKNTVNKAVYKYAESLGYQMSDDGDGSCVTFTPDGGSNDDTIDYSRSQHETYVLNWASDKCKADADKIEQYAQHSLHHEEFNYEILKPLPYKEGMYDISSVIDVDGNSWVDKEEALDIMIRVRPLELYSKL
jgi:hypothetical protein